MTFEKTSGVVLKSINYSETSKIVTIYSRDYGKIKVIAKGARRKKSDFLGKLEPFTQLDIVYIKGKKDLHILKECNIVTPYFELRNDLDRLSTALHILFLVDSTQAVEDANPSVYDLLVASLQELSTKQFSHNILFFFQLKLLDYSGYGFEFDKCADCGGGLDGKAFFCPAKGGFLCNKCRVDRKGSYLSRGSFEILRHLRNISVDKAGKIRLSKTQIAELSNFFETVFESILEKKSPVKSILDILLR